MRIDSLAQMPSQEVLGQKNSCYFTSRNTEPAVPSESFTPCLTDAAGKWSMPGLSYLSASMGTSGHGEITKGVPPHSEKPGEHKEPAITGPTLEEFKKNNRVLLALDFVKDNPDPYCEYKDNSLWVLDLIRSGSADTKHREELYRTIEFGNSPPVKAWEPYCVSRTFYQEPALRKDDWDRLAKYAKQHQLSLITQENYTEGLPLSYYNYASGKWVGKMEASGTVDMDSVIQKALPGEQGVKWALDIDRRKLVFYKPASGPEAAPELDNSYSPAIKTLSDLKKREVLFQTGLLKTSIDDKTMMLIDLNRTGKGEATLMPGSLTEDINYWTEGFWRAPANPDLHQELWQDLYTNGHTPHNNSFFNERFFYDEPGIPQEHWDKLVAFAKSNDLQVVTADMYPEDLITQNLGYKKDGFRGERKAVMIFPKSIDAAVKRAVPDGDVRNRWAIDVAGKKFFVYR